MVFGLEFFSIAVWISWSETSPHQIFETCNFQRVAFSVGWELSEALGEIVRGSIDTKFASRPRSLREIRSEESPELLGMWHVELVRFLRTKPTNLLKQPCRINWFSNVLLSEQKRTGFLGDPSFLETHVAKMPKKKIDFFCNKGLLKKMFQTQMTGRNNSQSLKFDP